MTLSKQRHLRNRLDRRRHGHAAAARLKLAAFASEEEKQIAADPLLRFAVMAERALARVELSIVMRAEHVVQVLVMNHGLDHERRDGRRGQQRMNADLRRHVIVRAEADRTAAIARDLLTPA